MNPLSRFLSLPLCLTLAAVALLSSCASAKKEHPMGHITKANDYHLKPGVRIETDDPMIRFEYMHRIRGAVESEEYLERYGHYFTVFWQGVDKGSDVTVRLEYRQSNTGGKLLTLESQPSKVKWRNTTEFEVTGEAYTQGGPVTAWRAVLIVDGQEADEFRSFLWQ